VTLTVTEANTQAVQLYVEEGYDLAPQLQRRRLTRR